MCVCMCVCVCVRARACVCVCMCVWNIGGMILTGDNRSAKILWRKPCIISSFTTDSARSNLESNTRFVLGVTRIIHK